MGGVPPLCPFCPAGAWARAGVALGPAWASRGQSRVSPPRVEVSTAAVPDPSPTDPPRERGAAPSPDHGAIMSELVTAQLRAARAEVFHAWLTSREKASRLANDDDRELPERRGAA